MLILTFSLTQPCIHIHIKKGMYRWFLTCILNLIGYCFIVTATAVLVIASTEVDKTGASYYGEQTLHYIATNGESAVVQLREYALTVSLWVKSITVKENTQTQCYEGNTT